MYWGTVALQGVLEASMLTYCCRPFHRRTFLPLLVLVGTAASGLGAGAVIGTAWNRSEVIPVVLVKPGIGGFVPTEGTSIGNTWSKDEVKAVLLVKPGIAAFEPVEGTSIGNQWSKGDVIAVVLTEPSGDGFSPMEISESGSAGANVVTPRAPASAGASSSFIEGQIDGDFNGWEGETIIRLTNGQIWQQTSYHYEYHYAFMPKVLIYKTGSGFEAKVDGTDEAVNVTRLK